MNFLKNNLHQSELNKILSFLELILAGLTLLYYVLFTSWQSGMIGGTNEAWRPTRPVGWKVSTSPGFSKRSLSSFSWDDILSVLVCLFILSYYDLVTSWKSEMIGGTNEAWRPTQPVWWVVSTSSGFSERSLSWFPWGETSSPELDCSVPWSVRGVASTPGFSATSKSSVSWVEWRSQLST